jgi:hypothetical protein
MPATSTGWELISVPGDATDIESSRWDEAFHRAGGSDATLMISSIDR